MLKQLYNLLLKEYGPQGWWPIQGVYDGRIPNEEEKLEICIGAILTQNTSWKNVEKALQNLGNINYSSLKNIPETKLALMIKPAGYFNQKAKKIKLFLNFLESTKEISRQNLLQVWGIGPETADSILLYSFNQPSFVIDIYTKRILYSYKIIKENATYDEVQNKFHKQIKKDPQLYKEYHALLVAHAKKHYSKKPFGINDPLKKYF